MAIEVTSPATIFDMAELGLASSRLQWAVVKEMHATGRTWAARAPSTETGGGRLILLCGLYPIDADTAEAWFNAAREAAPHMRAILRQVKLTIRECGYRDIVTVCRSDAGKRIASAAGFSFHAPTGLGEVWTWKVSSEEAAISPRNRRKPRSGNRSPTSPSNRPTSTRLRSAAAAPAGKPAARS
jgi:hypothetical protein